MEAKEMKIGNLYMYPAQQIVQAMQKAAQEGAKITLLTNGVGEKAPMCADSCSEFVGLGDIVCADGDETAVAYLHLAMEIDEEFCLTAIFGAKASTAED